MKTTVVKVLQKKRYNGMEDLIIKVDCFLLCLVFLSTVLMGLGPSVAPKT